MPASRLRLLALGLAMVAVTACSKSDSSEVPANRITFSDFEGLDGWLPATPTLATDKAHSGRFALKVDKDNEFATGYMNLLGKLSPTRLSRLTLRAWALRSGAEAKAAVVVQVIDPANPASKQAFWQSLDLTTDVKTFNRWTEVSKTFELPATLGPAQQLRVYLWRTGGNQPVYLDDVELVRE